MLGVNAYGSASDESDTSDARGNTAEKKRKQNENLALGIEMAPEVDVDASHTASLARWAMSQPVADPHTVQHSLRVEAPQGARDRDGAQSTEVMKAAIDETEFDEGLYRRRISQTKKRKRSASRKEKADDEHLLSRVLAGDGVWAKGNDEDDDDEEMAGQEGLSEEQKKYLEELEEKRQAAIRKAQEVEEQKAEEISSSETVLEGDQVEWTSEFHGTEEHDYQGRNWVEPIPTLRARTNTDGALIPKKLLCTFSGHRKGVSKVEFFPQFGHLLLSASLDTTLRIWGIYENGIGGGRTLMRTYEGHTGPVRESCFSAQGTKFLSSSYDKTCRLWDTETGASIMSFTNGAVAQCVKFWPADENIVLASCTNNMVVQWDLREKKIVQKYTYHDGPVNTITFYDQNRRFITTSDDKRIMAWDVNTPVPIRNIGDPTMQSMPFVKASPNGHFVACQSMDNQILVYDIREKVHATRRRLVGHNNAGFALPIDFSPNGKLIMSGDSGGKLVFWNFHSCKKLREIKVHNKPTLGAAWHPLEPSWVATCSWDSLIKLWE